METAVPENKRHLVAFYVGYITNKYLDNSICKFVVVRELLL
jgi:hypothetical protein